MEKPYKSIESGSYPPYIVPEDEESICKAVYDSCSVTFRFFEDEESANQFVGMFPKYVRVKTWRELNLLGNYGNKPESFHVMFHVSNEVTKVTGEWNEAGDKRLAGLVKTLKRCKLIS